MLVISRKKTERIVIAGDIEITILEIGRHRVRLGIQAPKQVTIHTRLKESSPAVSPDETQSFPVLLAAVGMPKAG